MCFLSWPCQIDSKGSDALSWLNWQPQSQVGKREKAHFYTRFLGCVCLIYEMTSKYYKSIFILPSNFQTKAKRGLWYQTIQNFQWYTHLKTQNEATFSFACSFWKKLVLHRHSSRIIAKNDIYGKERRETTPLKKFCVFVMSRQSHSEGSDAFLLLNWQPQCQVRRRGEKHISKQHYWIVCVYVWTYEKTSKYTRF